MSTFLDAEPSPATAWRGAVVSAVDEMGMRVYEQQPSGGGLPIDPPARRELPCLYRRADRGLLGTTVRGIQGQRHCSTSGRGESFSRRGSED